MVRAKLISTQGPWLEAIIEVQDQRLCVMDELGLNVDAAPGVGDELEIEFTVLLEEDEDWDEIFAGNPGGRTGLEQIDGWRYRAFGKIVAVSPVTVDCGLLLAQDVIHSSDLRLVGEYIAFTITRLGGRSVRSGNGDSSAATQTP